MEFYLFAGNNDNEVGNVENAVVEKVCVRHRRRVLCLSTYFDW